MTTTTQATTPARYCPHCDMVEIETQPYAYARRKPLPDEIGTLSHAACHRCRPRAEGQYTKQLERIRKHGIDHNQATVKLNYHDDEPWKPPISPAGKRLMDAFRPVLMSPLNLAPDAQAPDHEMERAVLADLEQSALEVE